ncbi:glycosyltransferase family 2 protein [Microbacterium sp. DT81.1]|uniref:glycosyltransferase family 2 protein n=1 Tax=Microbacterium sp. DT81.1 TaxID=3393413 RepID=UPI003CEEF630
MSAPKVSVIIPAYRVADFLPVCVERLSRQRYENFEIVLVEDGSGDATADVARALADAEPRVRAIILPENGGVARARERAVAESTGEYLWFVDADDSWPESALKTLVAAAEGADIVVADAEFHYQDGSRRPLRAPRSPGVDGAGAFAMLLRGEITGHLWNKLFRREVMAQASFAPARVQSDLIMVADALSYARSVRFTDQPVYEYRLRQGSVITSTSARAESLGLIDSRIRSDADRIGLVDTDDYRYFRARYIQLSGIKDALLASYPDNERRRHLADRRSELSWSDIALFAKRRDARRLALALTAKSSLAAHRALLRAADR